MDYLNICDITAKDNLILICESKSENKKVELSLTIARITEQERQEFTHLYGQQFIPLVLVVHEWDEQLRAISFEDTDNVELDLVITRRKFAFQCSDVSIVKEHTSEGKTIHLLLSKSRKAHNINRRRGLRVDVLRYMNIEQNNNKVAVFIKDISFCGIAFITSDDLVIDMSQPIVVHLMDIDSEAIVEDLVVKAVRRIEIGPSKVLYGCAVPKSFQNVCNNYVFQLQNRKLYLANKSGLVQVNSFATND